jgi:SAM-dependent methyltransferase
VTTSSRWTPLRYAPVAEYLLPAAHRCLELLGAPPGALLLDVATGTGNAVVAAAARGLRAVGVDSSAEQLEEAQRRCAGMDARFVVADAEHIPLPTASVDAATSLFGVIFAGDPAAALREMVRCVKPGGAIGFTTLSEHGWAADAGALLARHCSAPEQSPRVWPTTAAASDGALAAGLTDVMATSELLHWWPTPGRDPAEDVTSRLPVLAALRRRAEAAGTWSTAHAELADLLAVHTVPAGQPGAGSLADHYQLVICRTRR